MAKKPSSSSAKNAKKPVATGGAKLQIEKNEQIKGRRPKHPNYREIKLIMTDGRETTIWSTYKKDVMYLEIDRLTHPAWTGTARVANNKAQNVAKMNSLFDGLYGAKPQG